jgi:hypothetical protein
LKPFAPVRFDSESVFANFSGVAKDDIGCAR